VGGAGFGAADETAHDGDAVALDDRQEDAPCLFARLVHLRRRAAEAVVGANDVLGVDMLARERAHHHRVGEEHGRELLADGHHLVAGAHGDLAEEGDAAEDRVHLLDLRIELADERLQEV
jgi:hypothetical protein